MQLKSIFIDMDGTLTNFNINYKIAYNNAIKYLTKLGITDPDILNEYRLDDILKKLEPIIDQKCHGDPSGEAHTKHNNHISDIKYHWI